uniref:uncharacterized protein LOC131137424 n=1 Tax=Doryrhamphus excisus TaxID=161450 RepID=UPI0025AE0345|nr:uncharacterized protein LOC131137424 [Doryrhamphus excisus]XP_057941355.1 uncharacterized protein LOC131137424 [Doryrhamphus excisus]
MEKTIEERLKFVQQEKLCFGCLKNGHNSKACTYRSVCDLCGKRHPTCLHQDREKRAQEQGRSKRQATNETTTDENKGEKNQQSESIEMQQVTSNRVVQEKKGTHTSSIVPVYVSTSTEPGKEVLVYALLDSQSDTTFILQNVAEMLCIKKEPVKLKVSTITSKTKVVKSERVQGLQVRGIGLDTKIKLPTTYTRSYIPANRSHIPTCTTAKAWPHLEHLTDEMSPELDCEVGLLIGYNCPQALLPRDVITGSETQPYAQRSVLGWSIIGYSSNDIDYDHEDEIGVSHRIIIKKVFPAIKPSLEIKSEVQFVCRTQVKEIITPAEILKVFESDFTERFSEDVLISQEDIKFLTTMREGIKHKPNGHYEMPLPFKEERPKLPNNKVCAEHRLRCLEKRFRKDDVYHKHYVAFMEDIIAKGDAEKVSEPEGNDHTTWYIPHHGVYHPHKPGKIRVVFDCSAKFQNTSLNEHLLTGPDLTNTLVGVLSRFRKGQVALMCDVERMFHQFHVAPRDQDYLRFLWWEQGNIKAPVSVFRMKVHLFGAASSPGCANFGLKHLAAEGAGNFSEATVRFIKRDFYVDDGLTSLDSEAEAIQLVREARELCSAGKLHLHKFITNNRNLLDTIPKQELMKGMQNEHLKRLGCNFVMNPPASSHMGGVWERQIRTVRSVLTSILDQAGGRLDCSSLRTFLYEVMAIVNSRPLTTDHLNDPLGPEPLTPNHILTMKSSFIAPPPGKFVREDLYLQKRWKRVQFLSNVFWTRWRKEYLLNLQQRRKWNKARRNAKVNDIVLLQDNDTPRNQWKLAKVVEVFQGADGRVRKFKLLLSDTTLDSKGSRTCKPVYLERSVHKTVLLLEAE